jgi:hypothetical protein
MEYPRSVLTRNRKGESEVRNLLERGEFVRYNYTDPETGGVVESGKTSLILRSGRGVQHLFLIPLKDGRFLAVADRDKKLRHVWDGRKAVRI